MDTNRFRGVFAASVTPVDKRRRLDEGSIRALVDYYAESRLDGAFFPSSSGEYFALTCRQRRACVRAAVRAADGRLTIFANISDGSLKAAAENARAMRDAGADCAVLMPPAFHHHSQEELVDFFRGAADLSPLPLLIYAHLLRLPSRIEIPTLLELAGHPNILGVKDTHHDAARLMALRERLDGRDDFLVYTGGDGMAGFGALFGMEMLNALSAVRPDLFLELYGAGRRGDLREVSRLQQRVDRLAALFSALRGGQSSAALFSQAIKMALSLKGLCGTTAVQLGFELSDDDAARVKDILAGV